MRHRKLRHTLNRFTSWRKATITSLVRSLLKYERIQTTLARARAAQPLADKLIGQAKKNTLSEKRFAYRILGDHKLVSLLFNDIAARFQKRATGFTRIIKVASRRGDNAVMAIFELTEIKEKKKKVKAEKEAKSQAKVEVKPEPQTKEPTAKEKPVEEARPPKEPKIEEKPPVVKKPVKKFLGGIRNIFKKERDSL